MGVKIHNLDKCLKKIESIKNIDFKEPLSKGALVVVNKARDLAPVDLGQLIAGIWYEPRNGSFNNGVTIFSSADYSKFVEFGTSGPRFVPFVTRSGEETGIKGWAERHGIDTLNKEGIVVSGKEQPYLIPAFTQEKRRVEKYLRSYVKKEIDKLKIK
jgi:HK97 gp10 family phage protein